MCMAYRVGPRAFDGATPLEWQALLDVARESGRVK